MPTTTPVSSYADEQLASDGKLPPVLTPGSGSGAAARGGENDDQAAEQAADADGSKPSIQQLGMVGASRNIIKNIRAKQFVDGAQDLAYVRSHDMKRFMYMIPFIIISFIIWDLQVHPPCV